MEKKNKIVHSAEVESFKKTILTTAEDLVDNKFPKRIIQLNKMLSSGKLTCPPSTVYEEINIPIPDMSEYQDAALSKTVLTSADAKKSDSSSANGTPDAKRAKFSVHPAHLDTGGAKVLVLPNGTVSSNKFIVELINEIKPLIGELVEDTNLLKIWLTYLIPRIEDGNNFGVSIQEDVLAEIRASEGEAAAYYDQISRYFTVRGKTISRVAHYPHIDDYRRAIKELDEKEFFSLRLIVAELRNHYAILCDLIAKNGDKIRKPRSSNAENMF